MDVLLLSRMQFAVTTAFHFLFVPLTIGLAFIIAVIETRYVRTGDESYKRLARFWGKIFLINFAVGVVTGITLEFQFGTNWSRYSEYVGDIFGSLLAIEATTAFFLESTLLAVWVFGWNRISRKAHVACMWLIAVASCFSAVWILIANAWMQSPVGYVIRNGRAELDNFWTVVFQPFAWVEIWHTVSGAFAVGGFFVMGVSAWQILRNSSVTEFTRSFRTALVVAAVAIASVIASGHVSGGQVAKHQPTKLAAMEALWETQTRAPMTLILIPDVANERNAVEAISIPGALSMLAFNDPNAEVKGLKDFPKEDRPPVWPVFLSFRIMVALGLAMAAMVAVGLWRWRSIPQSRKYLKLAVFAIPLPYLANEFGWMVTEIGRQPWIVWGIMRTSDAASTVISSTQVALSLAGFIVVYSLVGLAAVFIMVKTIRKGLENA